MTVLQPRAGKFAQRETFRRLLFTAPVLAFISSPAGAALTISTAATQNMNCSGGVCAPTAANANLNVTDLENDLASGNLTVTTTGSGIEATDIAINAGTAWTSTNTLSLKAYHSIDVNQPVAVNGTSSLSVVTNNGGSGGVFSFASGANVTFLDMSSTLAINGSAYSLENSVASLASAVAANPAGNYALANNYDASKDGTYTHSPIATELSGAFEGLGNTVSNLSITANHLYVGMFSGIGSGGQLGGSLENIVLQNANVAGRGKVVGGLVGRNLGTVRNSFVTGSVSSDYFHNIGPLVGLLAGLNYGTIIRSGADGVVAISQFGGAGGLAAGNAGLIAQSYANCTVSAGETSFSGGLLGGNSGSISQSYAMGTARGANGSAVGGLVGENEQQATIAQSYSTTATFLHNRTGGKRGGLIGIDYSPAGSNANDDWDTTTSGVVDLAKGAGSPKNDPGITGLTSQQLQSGLPAGFDPTVWAENPNINGGFPYLIANPPR